MHRYVPVLRAPRPPDGRNDLRGFRHVAALPLIASGDDTGRIDEESSELSEVGNPSEVAVVPPGSTGLSLRLNLKPGHYVLFCNLKVEDLLHYQKGMHIDFTVT